MSFEVAVMYALAVILFVPAIVGLCRGLSPGQATSGGRILVQLFLFVASTFLMMAGSVVWLVEIVHRMSTR